MEYRKLGTEGPVISTIGFGTWAIGGAGWEFSWGVQDDQDSRAAIQTALDNGITWFDTAAAYGLGHAEELLGQALGSRRQDVLVATKFGLVWDDAGHIRRVATYDSVLRECDASLRRLGTDHIDLYQQHWPDEAGTPVQETMAALDALVKAGKVRHVGVSNYDARLLARALAVRRVDSLQPLHNLLERGAERDLLPFCRRHGIGVVAYSPLASGRLGGHYTAATTFAPGDWRSRDPRFSGAAFRRTLAAVEQLKAIAGRFGRTVPQLAIAWVLANPAVTAAIVGARRPDYVTSILPAADWHLDEPTKREIEAAVAGKQRAAS